MKTGTVATVEIESLAYRGEGIGHIQNKVVFVPLTAPGDRVDLLIKENRKNYLRGVVQGFRQRSPHRIVPLCDYFGECGGCQWQHLTYEYELDAKQRILEETLSRLGKVDPGQYELLPPVPSPKSYGYRSRIRLRVRTRRKTALGFLRSHSSEIVPVERCELVPPFTNSVLKKLDQFLNSLDYLTDFSEIQILACPLKEEATLSFSSNEPIDPDTLKHFLKALKEHIPKVYGVSFQVSGDGEVRTERFGNCHVEHTYTFTPAGEPSPVSVRALCQIHVFGQVNPEQNQNLLRTVYDWAEPKGKDTVLDLFCGAGNLSLPLAMRVNRVIGLENNPAAVEDARRNAELNGLQNCEFRLANVFSDLDQAGVRAPVDILLIDPPRKGVKECVRNIAALEPAKILYVSCDPSTLARDIALFTYSGYRLRRVQLLDMFPRTYHIECVAELTPGETQATA